MIRLAIFCLAALLVAGAANARPIRAAGYVHADDGARLYLLTRGDDPDAPVLVWLHGGPGGAERPLFRLYNGDLERCFVVGYWDQRGAGRSFDEAADPAALTIARHLRDLDRVVDHLRRSHRKGRVILVGHSWGATLGLLYAARHPGKVAAFVGVGQPVNERARQQSQYDFVLSEARRRGDADALDRIARIGEPPFSAAREIAIQRLVERYGGYFHRKPSYPLILVRAVLGGLVRPWEIGRMIRGNNVSLEAMEDEMLGLDLAASTPAVATPVVFMLGRHDRQVDSRQAASYFTALAAPAKRLMWFERSAHNPPFEEPARFNAALPRLLAKVGAVPAGHATACEK